MEVENLSSGERFADVSFDVRAGENYGIAGLVGARRTEILKTIFGVLPMTAGRIRVDGKGCIPHSARRSIRDGMVLTPEDRKAKRLILPFSVRQNIALSTLKALARGGILSSWATQRLANASIESLADSRDFGGAGGSAPAGRQPTAGCPCSCDQHFATRFPARRANARRRCGGKGRGLQSEGPAGRKGSGHRDCLFRSSRASWSVRSHRRNACGRLAGEVDRAEFSQDRLMSLAAVG